MDPKMTLLTKIVAYMDELHAPIRLWGTCQPANLFQRRALFRKAGFPWASGGTTEAARKDAQRAMETLVDEGAIKPVKRAGRTTGLFMTHEAELYTRSYCLADSIPEALGVLNLAIRDLQAGFGLGKGQLIPECNLTAKEDGTCFWYGDAPGNSIKPLIHTQYAAGYALTHGWLTSASDCHGRVYYGVTELGHSIAADPPTLPDGLPTYSREASDWHQEECNTWYEHFQTAAPPNPSDIAIPLPVCWWPLNYKKKTRMDES